MESLKVTTRENRRGDGASIEQGFTICKDCVRFCAIISWSQQTLQVVLASLFCVLLKIPGA